MKVYASPRTIFQQKINGFLNAPECSPIFEDIFKLQQLYSLERLSCNKVEESNWKLILMMYEALGSSNLAKMISIAKGKTLSLPTEEEFQDSIVTSLCYYYKEVENKSWEEIRKILNQPDLNTIKYGIRVRQFSQFIVQQTLKGLNKIKGCET